MARPAIAPRRFPPSLCFGSTISTTGPRRRCGQLDLHGLADHQGMLSFMLPPIPCGLFKKNSRLPSAASAY
jgi:hypothetical protein